MFILKSEKGILKKINMFCFLYYIKFSCKNKQANQHTFWLNGLGCSHSWSQKNSFQSAMGKKNVIQMIHKKSQTVLLSRGGSFFYWVISNEWIRNQRHSGATAWVMPTASLGPSVFCGCRPHLQTKMNLTQTSPRMRLATDCNHLGEDTAWPTIFTETICFLFPSGHNSVPIKLTGNSKVFLLIVDN